jgi:hypothetical protein
MAFPEVCIVDRETCANNLPVIKFYQYTNGIQEVILKDDCGEPVDLSEYDFACFLARDSYGMDPLYLNVKAELTDNNRLKIQLKDCQLTRAGIFLAEFVLFKSKSAPLDDSSESGSFYNCSNSSGFPQDLEVWGRYPAYLMVAESLAENRVRSNGLTIAEIRYAMMDRCAVDNYLLDNVEFDDSIIMWAMRRPIDKWNETRPILRRYTYTPANFPWRYYWVNGVMAELLKAAARNYSRNNLRYQGGGISINDKDKAQEYMAFGRELEAQYDDWIESTKLALNASQAWGTTFIPAFGYICGANNIQGIAAAANPVIGPLNQGGRIPEPNCCD